MTETTETTTEPKELEPKELAPKEFLNLSDPEILAALLRAVKARKAKKVEKPRKPPRSPNTASKPYRPPLEATWTPPKGPPARAVPRVGPDFLLGQQIKAQEERIRELQAEVSRLKENK